MEVNLYLDMIEGKYCEKFEEFKRMLLEYNNKFNLTAITDEKGIKIKHFLDSVMGESFIDKNSSVVEIGSGGGFPSVPLKIIRDDLNFTLVESTGKKCEYLKDVVQKLDLNCVKVINARAEELAVKEIYREKYDVAVARAVAKLNTLCEYCLPFVRLGGKFIAYKHAKIDEVIEAEKAIKVLGGELERKENYVLYEGEVRSVIVIKKVAPTPLKYPRGQGKERKCPIV